MSISYHRSRGLFGHIHTARVKGETLKDVKCSECGCEFTYRLQRTGIGNGIEWFWGEHERAMEVAARKAKSNLEELLNKEIDAAPCPDCRALQKDMIELPGSALWLKVLYFVFGYAALFIALTQVTETINALAVTSGAALIVIAFLLLYQYMKKTGPPKVTRKRRARRAG